MNNNEMLLARRRILFAKQGGVVPSAGMVDDADNVVVGIDYLTTNESFETN